MNFMLLPTTPLYGPFPLAAGPECPAPPQVTADAAAHRLPRGRAHAHTGLRRNATPAP